MKHFLLLSLLAAAMVPFHACTKIYTALADTVSDKQIYIPITPVVDVSAQLLPQYEGYPVGALPSFNINDYPGVDSVVLASSIVTFAGSSGYLHLELFDATDSTVIAGSQDSASIRNGGPKNQVDSFPHSGNFYHSIPRKPVNLLLYVYNTSEEELDGYYTNTYIILYRP